MLIIVILSCRRVTDHSGSIEVIAKRNDKSYKILQLGININTPVVMTTTARMLTNIIITIGPGDDVREQEN